MDYTQLTEITKEIVSEIFTYYPWEVEQIDSSNEIRDSLAKAFKTVVNVVPPSPTRTRALNAIIDARMLANAAITFKGKY
jgi:hypothetical protein